MENLGSTQPAQAAAAAQSILLRFSPELRLEIYDLLLADYATAREEFGIASGIATFKDWRATTKHGFQRLLTSNAPTREEFDITSFKDWNTIWSHKSLPQKSYTWIAAHPLILNESLPLILRTYRVVFYNVEQISQCRDLLKDVKEITLDLGEISQDQMRQAIRELSYNLPKLETLWIKATAYSLKKIRVEPHEHVAIPSVAKIILRDTELEAKAAERVCCGIKYRKKMRRVDVELRNLQELIDDADQRAPIYEQKIRQEYDAKEVRRLVDIYTQLNEERTSNTTTLEALHEARMSLHNVESNDRLPFLQNGRWAMRKRFLLDQQALVDDDLRRLRTPGGVTWEWRVTLWGWGDARH